MNWEVVTGLIGALAPVLDWLRSRRDDGRVWARIDDHDVRLRAVESRRVAK